MDIVDEYAIKKCVYKDLPFKALKEETDFNDLTFNYDFVTLFTDWKEERFTSLWASERIYAENYEEYEKLA